MSFKYTFRTAETFNTSEHGAKIAINTNFIKPNNTVLNYEYNVWKTESDGSKYLHTNRFSIRCLILCFRSDERAR